MIEIKNKHIVVFPEDRLIGAQGDVNSAQRKFVLGRIQGGFDLSDMVAWIKIDPVGSGENPYEQMLIKEIVGDNIILTWSLSGANLKSAGELSVQIIFAAKDYFDKNDLAGLSDNDLIVPAVIKGVCAPVWQSYPETFIVCESIDDTVAYEEVTKNVLVSAAASAVGSAQSALEAAGEAKDSAQSAMTSALSASRSAAEVKENVSNLQETYQKMDECVNLTYDNLVMSEERYNAVCEKVNEADGVLRQNLQIKSDVQSVCDEVHLSEQNVRNMADSAAESAALAQSAKDNIDSAIISKEDKSNKIKEVGDYGDAEFWNDENYLSALATNTLIDSRLEKLEGHLTQDVIPPLSEQNLVNEINDETIEYGDIYYPTVNAVVGYIEEKVKGSSGSADAIEIIPAEEFCGETATDENVPSSMAVLTRIDEVYTQITDEIYNNYGNLSDWVEEKSNKINDMTGTWEDERAVYPSVRAVKDYVQSTSMQYRKIFEYTVAEDDNITSFDIERDTEGNGFNLSEFIVYFEHQGYPEKISDATSYLKVTLKVDGRDYSFNGAAISCLNQIQAQYVRVEFLNRGRWIANGVVDTVEAVNLGIKSLTTAATRTSVGANYDGKLATGIRIGQTFGTVAPFTVGTKVEVWGR